MTAHSDSLDALATALSQAQAEFVAIPKDSTNPFFKSKYAGLPQVVLVASPILTKHGLSVSQFIGHDDQGDTLTTWLLHKSGQWISESMRLHLTKDDAQGQGSATTYARRYSYMSVLGLVADEDDDGNQASARSTAARSSARPSGNGQPLATASDVHAMKKAADGLEPDQVKLALAACGLNGVTAYSKVPANKAAALTKALAGMERTS